MKNITKFFKKRGQQAIALVMVVVLTITGLTLSNKANAATEGLGAKAGMNATLSIKREISGWDDFYPIFGNHNLSFLTLTKNNGDSDAAYCIAPGVEIYSGSTYTSKAFGSVRVVPYYKAAIAYSKQSDDAGISNDAQRSVTQLFVWRIAVAHKTLATGTALTNDYLHTASFKNVVIKVLTEHYGYNNTKAEDAYSEARKKIFRAGENNEYADSVDILKWDDGAGQTLLTGEFYDEVKIRIGVKKTVVKNDGSTLSNGVKAGCKYTVYTDSNCTTKQKDKDGNNMVITIPTNGYGYSTYALFEPDDVPRRLYVKETYASTGSAINEEVHRIYIDPNYIEDGKTYTFTVDNATNNGWYGQVRMKKVDDRTGEPLADAEFTIYEWNSSSQRYVETSIVLKTGSDGYSSYTQPLYYTSSNVGKFKIVETKYPENYQNTGYERAFIISRVAQTFTLEARNKMVERGSINLVKRDSSTTNVITGAEFRVYKVLNATYDNAGNIVNEDLQGIGLMYEYPDNPGYYFRENIEFGTYKIVEYKSPDLYWVPILNGVNMYQYVVLSADNLSATVEFKNDPIVGVLNIKKKDSETEEGLPGAVFELWETDETGSIPALETEDTSISTGSAIVEDEEYVTDDSLPRLVGTATTDENGEITFTNIYQGKYYAVREIVAPVNYELDSTVYKVTDLKDLEAVRSNNKTDFTKTITITNDPIKIPIRIHKTTSSRSGAGSTNLEGATFSIYDVTGVSDDSLVNFSTTGKTPVAVITTDENGYAESEPLRVGRKYICVETGVPFNYIKCEDMIVELDVSYGEAFEYEAIDPLLEARLEIYKTDSRTNEIVKLEGFGFKVYDVAKQEYVIQTVYVPDEEDPDIVASTYDTDTFYTDENGCCRLPEVLAPGTYEIREVVTKGNYVLAGEPVSFTISSDEEFEIDPISLDPLVKVLFNNDSVEGEIEIIKTGETVKAVNDDGAFVYEQTPLKNVKFALKAAENIYTADNTGTLLYSAGDLVDTEETNSNGKLKFSNLPLGNYIVCETETVDGYTINTQEYPVELKYVDENTPTASVTLNIENTRQKVNIKVVKKDEDTEELLAGAIFGVYANKDIIDKNGNVIVAKGDLLETQTTDESGEAYFGTALDYPISEFVLKEIKAAKGYVTSNEEIVIDALSAPQDSLSIDREYIVYNEITTTEISKSDITTGEEIPGCTLRVWYIDESGYEQTVDEWVSTTETHFIKGLEVGKEYTLTELVPANGYVTATDIKFTISNTAEVQKVEMVDDYSKVEISKSDITTGKPVIGATLQIISKDTNEVIAETITKDEPWYIEKLPIGDYILRETICPTNEGFVTAEDVEFTVKDTGEIQKVEMFDDYTKLEIHKLSLVDGTFVEGAELQLINSNDLVVAQFITQGAAIKFERLPVGTYTLREVKPPTSFKAAADIVFEIKDTADTQTVIMYDDVVRGTITLTKVDADDENKTLSGAEFTIYDEDGNEVGVMVTDENGVATSNKLALGTYTVKETQAPNSYNKTSKTWTVELKTDGNVDIVAKLGKVKNKKKTTLFEAPQTGVMTGNSIYSWGAIFAFILAGVVATYMAISLPEKKKEDNENDN